MLVLSRKLMDQVLIGSDVRITVVKIDRNQIRLGIEAPDDVMILRGELLRGFDDDTDTEARALGPFPDVRN